MEYRLCQKSDAPRLRTFHLDNRDHLQPWEPTRDPDYDSIDNWKARVEQLVAGQEDKTGAYFVAVDSGQVLAMCNLNNVIRGAFQACYMGFGVARKHEGSGMMTRLCQAAIEYAFSEMGLHRIMANHMPGNERSAKLLARLGFEQEGYAKRYLKINGQWEDHVLTALINPQSA